MIYKKKNKELVLTSILRGFCRESAWDQVARGSFPMAADRTHILGRATECRSQTHKNDIWKRKLPFLTHSDI